MRSRITQLIARFIGAGALFVAAKMGLSDDQQATLMQYVGEIAAWIVGVGAFVVDLLIHRMETGSVTAPAGTSKQQDSSHTLTSWAWPALLAMSLLCLAGCAATETDRYYQQVDTANHARATILALHASEAISDAKMIELDAYEKAWRSALALIKQRIDAGQSSGESINAMLDTAEAAMAAMIDFLKLYAPESTPTPQQGAFNDESHGSHHRIAGRDSGDRGRSTADGHDQFADRPGQTKRQLHARADRGYRGRAGEARYRVGRGGGGCESPTGQLIRT